MMAVFNARYACAAVRPGPRTLAAERRGLDTRRAIVLRRQRATRAGQPRNAARASRYMPKIIKRLRNFGYRVPFLRRRFQLEDLLLVGLAVGGSFAVVLGWILWVHWRIL